MPTEVCCLQRARALAFKDHSFATSIDPVDYAEIFTCDGAQQEAALSDIAVLQQVVGRTTQIVWFRSESSTRDAGSGASLRI